MFCSHDVCVAWEHLGLTNLELLVHLCINSVVPSSQPEQDNLLWPVQLVEVLQELKLNSYFDSLTFRRRVGRQGIDDVGGIVFVVRHRPLVSLDDVFQLGHQGFVNVGSDEDSRHLHQLLADQRLLDLHKHLHIAIHARRGLEVKAPPVNNSSKHKDSEEGKDINAES